MSCPPAAASNYRFQSLFRWITFPDNAAVKRGPEGREVSILVPLDHLPRRPCGHQGSARRRVSILVPLDHLPRLGRIREGSRIKQRFQSLFRWITFPDLPLALPGRLPAQVSILVPLDHLPRPVGWRADPVGESGFQSLFRWITFPDLCVDANGDYTIGFQSLFRWITFPDRMNVPPSAGQVPVSILVPLDHLPRLHHVEAVHHLDLVVSILVRLGSPSPTTSVTATCSGALEFQSLFRWITFPDSRGRPGWIWWPCWFQSLFRWITFPDLAGHCASRLGNVAVSILVPLDHLPRRYYQHRLSLCWAEFQSLFRWITFPDPAGDRWRRTSHFVSILVPLDHLPRLVDSLACLCAGPCFNPCSAGSPSPTGASSAVPGRPTAGFNPCSAGSPSPTGPTLASGYGRGGFQSLFRWITFPDSRPECRAGLPARGFNPCSAGSPSPTSRSDSRRARCSQFQSLFRWITFPDAFTATERRADPMFQSLFRWITFPDIESCSSAGCTPRVSILVPLDHLPRHGSHGDGHGEGMGFQSLFRWITFPDCQQWRSEAVAMFQSLFRWITFPDIMPTRFSDGPNAGFNPCSAGSPSPTSLGSPPIVENVAGGFNPCSAGSPSPTPWHLRLRTPHGSGCFNPCSAGSPSPTNWQYVSWLDADVFQSLFRWITFPDS